MFFSNSNIHPALNAQCRPSGASGLDVGSRSHPVKTKLAKRSFVALFAFAAANLLSAAEPSSAPRNFSAYIGGFEGPTYLVELRDNALTYTSGPRNKPNHTRITPTAAQWQEFRQTLDALDVWRWRSNYTNNTFKDGTQWRISLEYADRALKTEGSNDYPKHFDRYLAAIQKLLGGKTFK